MSRATLLPILLIFTLIAAQPRLGTYQPAPQAPAFYDIDDLVRYDVKPTGVIHVEEELKATMAAYLLLKRVFPTPSMILRELRSERVSYELENVTVSYDDAGNRVVASYDLLGAAVYRGGGYWEIRIGPEARLIASSGNLLVFHYEQPFVGGLGKLRTTLTMTLPTTRYSVRRKAGVTYVRYAFEPPVGTGDPLLDYEVKYRDRIMSALYKAYANPNLGLWVAKVVVRNRGDGALRNLKVEYRIVGYVDWIAMASYPLIPPGGGVVDVFHPSLPSKVMELTSPTPVDLQIRITYEGGEEIFESFKVTLLGHNDFVFTSLSPEESTGTFYDTFNNAPYMAAFVTPADPPIMKFSDTANRVLAGGIGATESDEDAIKVLAAIWQALVNVGVTYKHEPAAYWTGRHAQYVKYPRDVLKDKAGTCIDLALLFASLAEAQGLRTAIVLVPGHAFPVVYLPSGSMVAVETTMVADRATFQEALRGGAEQLQRLRETPYIIVDVEDIQARGVLPPELPRLPEDALERWGITAETIGGGAVPPQPQPQPQPTVGFRTFERWGFSIQYPGGWEVEVDEEGPSVTFWDPEGRAYIRVWREEFEGSSYDYMVKYDRYWGEEYGVEKVAYDTYEVSGVQGYLAKYDSTWKDEASIIMAIWVARGGYGYAAFFEVLKAHANDPTLKEALLRSLASFALKP